MNKLRYLFIGIVITTLLIVANHWYTQKDNKEATTPNPGVAAKQAPADHFYLQRSYPDHKYSQKKYLQAMKSAQFAAVQRSDQPGFDQDWTTQGPGNAGARVNAVLVHPTDPTTIYLGYSGGGIFKTTDDGNTWEPIFDDQPYLAIGHMAFDPNNPETVYVGTGDPSITGYPFIGDGIYKTTDGGNTWTNIGLSETRIISRIIVHPNNSQIIYAATMGIPFQRNNDRGLYKSTDGGNTWEQILFINNETGVIDLVMHPTNPDILFAGIWTRIRTNQESTLTSLGHKIYRTLDGGQNWQPIANGLPIGEGSRVSVAISQQNPGTVFASFTGTNFQLEGIYKTTDNGDSWVKISDSGTPIVGNSLFGFGWYLGRLRVNPNDDNELFVLGVPLVSSTNGGANWNEAAPFNVHVDNHAIAFDSQGNVVLGNDGGAYRRRAGTLVWEDIENIPTTQVYRVAYNPHEPNTYYGGFQDNGTQSGNAGTINNWQRIRGADGFQMAFNPDDPLNYYAEIQNGGIAVTQNGNNFSSATGGISNSDRRNWDMQYFISPHESNTLYTGTFRVYKSTDRGDNWDVMSQDLTDGIIFSPSFHTISTLDESTLSQGRIYVGTTDANVWRTTNDGQNWDNISANLPERYVTSVKASPFYEDGVYATFSGYRDNDNTSYVYRSLDGGNNWTNIANNLPTLAINDILVLPGHQDTVLVIANDAGVYASLNAGESWDRLGGNFPMVPVYDLVYNEVNNQVVAASHGRSILSFDLNDIGVFEAVQMVGTVMDRTGQPIPDVRLNVNQLAISEQVTTETGTFQLNKIPINESSCVISLQKNTPAIEGVNISDLIILQDHILLFDTLDSPYQWLAADVNLNEALTVGDLIDIRDLILLRDTAFAETESWRFVPADFSFPAAPFPWTGPLEWEGDCSNLNQPVNQQDFIAIKMGDLNASADVSELYAEGDTRSTLALEIENRVVEAGETYIVTAKIHQPENYRGLACQLEFDPAGIELLSTTTAEHNPAEYLIDYHLNSTTTGHWTGLAGGLGGKHLAEVEALFTWKIKVLQDGSLSDFIKLSSTYDQMGLMDNNATTDIELTFSGLTTGLPLITNSVAVGPNPFTDYTTLTIASTNSQPMQLQIFSTNGTLISTRSISTAAEQEILEGNLFKQPGIYWMVIEQGEERWVKKLVKL